MFRRKYTTAFQLSFVGFALSLFIPSLDIVHKYLGGNGIIAYIAASPLAVLVLHKLAKRIKRSINENVATWLAVVTFLSLVIGFFLIYPIANSGVIGGGSDADDALNLAASELIHGRYPYYPSTYLGNPIAPLPGAVLLSLPFVLLGNSSYQSLFWIAAFFAIAKIYLKDIRLALLLIWSCLALSPVILNNVVTGVDEMSNGIYVLIFILLLVTVAPKHEVSVWKKVAAAMLLGIALSSRSNFVLLVPLVFGMLVRNSGWRNGTKYIFVTSVTFVLVTIPFWLFSPQSFSPLYIQYSKVSQFESILPLAGLVIPLAGGALALLLAYCYSDGSYANLLRNGAIVLAFPVVCTMLLSLIQGGFVGIIWAGYGVFFLPFGALAYWGQLYGRPQA